MYDDDDDADDKKKREEYDGGKCEVKAKFWSPLDGVITTRKYFSGSDVDCIMMAALGSFENELYRLQPTSPQETALL